MWIFGFLSPDIAPGLAQRMSLQGSGRKTWRQLTGTARSPATGITYQRLNLKANTGTRNWWRRQPRAKSLDARLHAVAYRAEFGERLRPGIGARHADESDEGAAAEAHPLHQLHRGIGLGVLGLGLDLVGLLLVEAEQIPADDAHILEVGQAGKKIAREIFAIGGLLGSSGRDRDDEHR